jgi:hypothetical protein
MDDDAAKPRGARPLDPMVAPLRWLSRSTISLIHATREGKR